MEEEQKVERVKKQYLYLGVYLLRGSEKRHQYLDVTGQENNGRKLEYHDRDVLLFKSNLFSNPRVGMVYNVSTEVIEGGERVYSAKDQPWRAAEGIWANEDQVALWHVQSQAALDTLRWQESEKETGRRSDLQNLLAPIREAYINSRSTERRAILAAVIEAITGR